MGLSVLMVIQELFALAFSSAAVVLHVTQVSIRLAFHVTDVK